MDYEESEAGSALPWLIGGVALGVVLGVLFAPKGGEELREDLSDYFDRAREKGRGLIDRVSDKIPTRVKTAGIVGAVKGAGGEVYREAKERFNG